MNDDRRDPDLVLDGVLDSIRRREAPDEAIRTAGERTRTLLRASLAGESGVPSAPASRRKALGRPRRGVRPLVAVAAVLGVAAALGLVAVLLPSAAPAGPIGSVAALEGEFFLVSKNGLRSLSPGEPLLADAVYRTSHGGGAQVRLNDKSLIEIDERSSFSVSQRHHETTIALSRGAVIVDASPQGSGHLRVTTPDCRVAVKGTVFSVRSGAKGSRVSVLEGEVHVDAATGERVLLPGDQVTTSEILEEVPLAEEIAWSARLDERLALLAELKAVGDEIERTVQLPVPRRSHALLDISPADTTVFLALPNVADALAQAQDVIEERTKKSDVLSNWWAETADETAREELRHLMSRVRAFGRAIDDEVVIAFSVSREVEPEGPVVMARIRDRGALDALLAETRAMAEEAHDPGFSLAVHDGGFGIPEVSADAHVLIAGDVVALARSTAQLRDVLTNIQNPARNAFRERTFFATLAAAYDDGASWLFGADIERLVESVRASNGNSGGEGILDFLGLADAQHIVAEHLEDGGASRHEIALTFDQERSGVISWLAEPGPIGSLDFISPRAGLAVAFVIQDPGRFVEADLLQRLPPDLRAEISEGEARLGVNIVEDLAGALGGEVAFAIDGPLLPSPTWRFAIEVYDAARVQRAIDRLVEASNDLDRGRSAGAAMEVRSETRGDRTFHEIRLAGIPYSIHYAFIEGYLVAAPAPQVVEQAIAERERGYTLLTSPDLASKMPRNARSNFSGLVYENLAVSLRPLANQLATSGRLSDEQKATLHEILGDESSSLTWIYAGPRRIDVSGSREGGLIGIGARALLGGGGLANLASLLETTDSAEREP